MWTSNSAANWTDHRSASNIGADGSVNLKLAAATVSAGNVPPTNPTATPMSWGAYWDSKMSAMWQTEILELFLRFCKSEMHTNHISTAWDAHEPFFSLAIEGRLTVYDLPGLEAFAEFEILKSSRIMDIYKALCRREVRSLSTSGVRHLLASTATKIKPQGGICALYMT